MAKSPQWQADVVPSGGGPLQVRSRGTAAQGLAYADLGRALAGLGSFLTREGKEAQERIETLNRQVDVSRFARDATRGYQDLKADLIREHEPNRHLPRYEQFATDLRDQLAAIGSDETRAEAEIWLNDQETLWRADVATGAMQTSIQRAERHFKVLADDAMDRRDISVLDEHLAAMVSENLLSEGEAADLRQPIAAQIEKDLAFDAIAAKAMSMPYKDAVSFLDADATFRGLGLPAQEIADFRATLHAKLDVERAAAAQLELAKARARDEAERKALADYYGGRLTTPADISTIIEQMEQDLISPQVAGQIVTALRKPPPRQNDPDVFMQTERLVSDVRNRRITVERALESLKRHASKMTQQRYEHLVTAIEGANDPADPLGRSDVRLWLSAMAEHYDQFGSFGDKETLDAQVAYMQTVQAFEQYVTENPGATPDEINAKAESLLTPHRKTSAWKAVWNWFTNTNRPELTTYPGGVPAPFPSNVPVLLDLGLELEDSSDEAYELPDAKYEPLTQQDFEDTVKNLMSTDEEAAQDYYNKWVHKWQ